MNLYDIYKILVGSDTTKKPKWMFIFGFFQSLIPLTIFVILLTPETYWLNRVVYSRVFIIVAYSGFFLVTLGSMIVFWGRHLQGPKQTKKSLELGVVERLDLPRVTDLRAVALFFIFCVVIIVLVKILVFLHNTGGVTRLM
jgi:hypothetical protein